MDFWHQYYSNPGEQGYSPALEPEETQQRQLTHRSMRTLGNKQERRLQSSPNIICVNKSKHFRCAGNMAYNGTEETYTLHFRGDRRKPFGKPRHRWKENTRMDLKPTG